MQETPVCTTVLPPPSPRRLCANDALAVKLPLEEQVENKH